MSSWNINICLYFFASAPERLENVGRLVFYKHAYKGGKIKNLTLVGLNYLSTFPFPQSEDN